MTPSTRFPNSVRRTPAAVLAAVTLLWAMPGPLDARQARPAPSGVLSEARPLFDARLRHESVDQETFERDARGLTLRARIGAESGRFLSTRLLAEADLTRAVGIDDFNSTVDGPADRPVILDPDSERINRLHLTWDGGEGTTVRIGRQRIIHDHARFVGNVGFRQNEQTFDAVRLQFSPGETLTLDYAHVWQVNRIAGSNSPAGTESSDSHLVRLTWPVAGGTLGAHAYYIDLEDRLVGASNRTLGLRHAGQRTLQGPWRMTWSAGFSRQRDHGGNPERFSLDYRQLSGGLERGGLSGVLGLEVLEGNGERGFVTPLATLHAFQGFADLFLSTPAEGLRDRHVRIGYRATGVDRLGTVSVVLGLHDFSLDSAPETGEVLDPGREVNLAISARPRPGIELSFKVADHDGARVPDTRKAWLTAELSLP